MKNFDRILTIVLIFMLLLVCCGSNLVRSIEPFNTIKYEAQTLSAGPNNEAVTGKYLALTFDDGPYPPITTRLLDELKSRNVKCTFFLLGLQLSLYPEVAQRIHDEGHELANHTYSHLALRRQSSESISDEVGKTRALLSEITGGENFYVRLPFGDGSSDERVLAATGAPVVLWSVDPTNGVYPASEEQLYNGLIKNAADGAIMLLHDSNEANINAALRAIDTLKAQGYTFVTVDELFRIKGITPENGKVYFRAENPDPTGYDESRIAEHWAYPAIRRLAELGIMDGENGFAPNGYMSRALAATLLWRAAGSPQAQPAGLSDVDPKSWFAAAADWGVGTGIVTGFSADSFGPHDYVSREEFCVMLVRFADCMGIGLSETAAVGGFTDDSKISDRARPSVERLLKSGFVSANGTSVFRPGETLTRGEAAEMIVYIINKIQLNPEMG